MSAVPGPGRQAWLRALAEVEAGAKAELQKLYAAWHHQHGKDRQAFRRACLPGLKLRGEGPDWPLVSWVVVARGLLRDPGYLTR